MNKELTVRLSYEIDGIVQGVGFRPAVYRLAVEARLGGTIQNKSGSVHLVLEGTPLNIGAFITTLHSKLPSLARIDEINVLEKHEISKEDITEFRIIDSASDFDRSSPVIIPADIAMCSECEREILDCEDRRYGYPFTTCTDCGPRYTVVNDMPYDRERTTLSQFPLCDKCADEYSKAGNRRFHAESIACPECGPKLELCDSSGQVIEKDSFELLKRVRFELKQGKIIALRGIGGYLLTADAANPDAIKRLREKKNRPSKPFAVMFRDIETVFNHCKFNSAAVQLFHSIESPIVILPLKPQKDFDLSLISPDSDTVGAMVPYSPLHKLLCEPLKGDELPPFEALIMTSGNRGGEPICISNEEAFERLNGIADFFVCHDRKVNLRNDDSLCAIQRGKPQVWRRARGYAPQPIKTVVRDHGPRNTYHGPRATDHGSRATGHGPRTSDLGSRSTVLAMGAELKNAIAVGYNDEIVLSPHIGDLESPEAVNGMENVSECFPKFLNKNPDLIVVDMHPDMQSTRVGRAIAGQLDIPVLEVQHHHAHAAACMAEHGLNKAIALIFDGTGLGADGTIWGAECFYVGEEYEYRRIATFAPSRLPGGDSAVREPSRQLISRFFEAGIEIDKKLLKKIGVTDEKAGIWLAQIRKGVNSPLSHAAGRLFDAVSVLLGIAPEKISYEGQAPIALEGIANLAEKRDMEPFPFKTIEKDGLWQIDWSSMFRELTAKFSENDIPETAYAFHKTVAKAAVNMVEIARSDHKTDDIVLSGGVFMNKILTDLVADELESKGLNVFIPRAVPPNDGGIAFGQAVIGRV